MNDDQLQSALPDVTTPQRFDALEGEATIHRDAWGIPHIRAGNESDLYFAQGFATAQDRLWHMDADRHQALGRWSEWVGARGLARDRLLRSAGMVRTALLDLEACSDAARSMVDAYTAGVNAFIESTAALPIEYTLLGESPEPWEAWHCVAVYKIRNSLLGTFEPKLWRSRWLLKAGVDEVLALVGEGSAPGQLLSVPPAAEYDGPPLDGRAI
ncbi:MAG: penicillin acylase family protein, partial [Candidatus Latescibacterota bacterium]|nr:penicillin acylase family protein [Candidatus Latescibacterota bacterium]